MITVEQYAKIVNITPSEELTAEEIEEQISLTYLLESTISKRLEKLKTIALSKNLEFANPDLNTQGFPGQGNATTEVNKPRVIEVIGLDNFIELSTITEKAVKEKFGDKSDELRIFKENISKVPSSKKIYKIEILKG